MSEGPVQILDPDGELRGDVPDGLDDKDLVELYRLMVLSRQFDRKALAAQRQGRLGTYAMLEGQEAAQVGSAYAFGPDDFIYPSYREHGVQLARGMPLEVVLAYWKGLPNANWDVKRYGMMVVAVPIASHLPHAVGHAYAARLRGERVVTAAYFGDGATSETDFHSGLNFAGVWRTPTVFFCQNNFYAISVPFSKQTASESVAAKAVAYGMPGVQVDGMDVLAVYQVTQEAIARARQGEGPTLIEAICYRYGPHATADDARLYRSKEEEDSWRPRDPLLRYRLFLEARGLWSDNAEETLIAETGPAVERAIDTVNTKAKPGRDDIVRHAFAKVPRLLVDQLHESQESREEPPTGFGDDEVWEPEEDPEYPGPTKTMTMAEAINAALAEGMERHPSLTLQGEDVAVAGGVFRITEGLYERFGEERVIDTPLNESGIVGTAIGMAISGSPAIAEIQFDGFVYPGFDQIVSHLGRIRFRTRGNVEVPVVVRFPNGAGIGAHEHHCDSPEAYFAHAPGLVVVVPSTPTDAKGLLTSAIDSPDPVIFLEPKVLYRAGREDVPTNTYRTPLGKGRIRREGSDITVVTYGAMVRVCLAATEQLDDIDAEVIDLRTIYPWDVDLVAEAVNRTGRLLMVQEPQRSFGVGAEVVAEIAQRCGYSLEGPPMRIGATDAPWPQFAIEKHALVDEERVVSALRQVVAG